MSKAVSHPDLYVQYELQLSSCTINVLVKEFLLFKVIKKKDMYTSSKEF